MQIERGGVGKVGWCEGRRDLSGHFTYTPISDKDW